MNGSTETEAPLLEVDGLGVTFYTPRGTFRAVRDASLEIARGEVVGLVGESGCGKSTVAFAMMGYLPGTARVDGTIRVEGANIAELSQSELRDLRGNRVAMVYQDPATALNPSMRVGAQLEEVLLEHMDIDSQGARQRTVELFESVGLADPEQIGRRYPHELSGGMQQRVVIAMALACDPHLLIMDEPTTGLDVTTEATILDLVVELKDRVNAGILFVSHNLGVIARVADRVAVMYAGEVVEQASVSELFKNPRHPYTAGLLSCVPRPPGDDGIERELSSIPGSVLDAQIEGGESCLFADRCPLAQDVCTAQAPPMTDLDGHFVKCLFTSEVHSGIWGEAQERQKELIPEEPVPVLNANGLHKFYGNERKKYVVFGPPVQQPVRALIDVDMKVGNGRTLGVVGESGSGKSTAAKAIVGLIPKDGGKLELRGQNLEDGVQHRTEEQRAAMRMVFQNPTASLNPKLPIRHSIIRALRKFAGLDRDESRERAEELLEAVGLDPSYLDRPPSELSGGQQQRVALAGAFAASPDLIVADEAVSSLDVSVQAQVLNLLEEHQREYGNSYVFITHDLGVVRYVSDDILVLYAGHVAEYGPAEAVLGSPSHPYTEALLSAAPIPDPEATQNQIRLEGSVPTLRTAFQGCFFAGRCPRKIGDICDTSQPPEQAGPNSEGHIINCHIPVDELAEIQQQPVQNGIAVTP
ncbi:MAG: ABC transporter ATP-binding protein [SAR202 cluster bacterium]|jgi:peptide/nickel transport system ATP-binding protein|nr:ABC transporter ATP-binding protein [SAR202 cluster bacterium]MDP6511803.1 ABC transporter ATP-binding protein [SAR202 cluster bacterium]MDP6713752.1 ABC transporter ATP-binding protein [SAR202 cluster bacterium]